MSTKEADDQPKVVNMDRTPHVSISRETRVDVVDFTARLAEMGRCGEIVGVAAVFQYADESTGRRAAGVVRRSLLGNLELLKADMIDLLRTR